MRSICGRRLRHERVDAGAADGGIVELPGQVQATAARERLRDGDTVGEETDLLLQVIGILYGQSRLLSSGEEILIN